MLKVEHGGTERTELLVFLCALRYAKKRACYNYKLKYLKDERAL